MSPLLLDRTARDTRPNNEPSLSLSLTLFATRLFECTRDCSSHDALHAALDDSWLAREFASLRWQERGASAWPTNCQPLSVTSESSRSIGQCHVRRVAVRYGWPMRMLSEMIVLEEDLRKSALFALRPWCLFIAPIASDDLSEVAIYSCRRRELLGQFPRERRLRADSRAQAHTHVHWATL